MTLSIYCGIKKNKPNSLVYGKIAWIWLALISIANLTSCISFGSGRQEIVSATQFPEKAVENARVTILNFETLWTSELAHRNPKIQNELATGKYLEYLGYERFSIVEEPFWLVTDSATLESIKLTKYKEDYFKAEACVQRSVRKIKPDGSLIDPNSRSLSTCGVYVFIKKMDVWKLLGYVDTTDPSTYDYAPEWLKEIIGEIP